MHSPHRQGLKFNIWIVVLVIASTLVITAAVATGSSANSVMSNDTQNLPSPFAQAYPAPNAATLPDAPLVLPTGIPVLTKTSTDPFTWSIVGHRIINTQLSLAESTVVVIGTVKQIKPARWTTQEGKRPSNPHASPDNSEGGLHSIFRPMILEVEEYLVGELPQRQLHVYNNGGTVGQDSVEVIIDGLYDFVEGERVVLFLTPHKSPKHAQSPDKKPFFDVIEHYTISADNQATSAYHSVLLEALRVEITSGGIMLAPTLVPTTDPVPSVEVFPTSAPSVLP